MTAAAAPRSGSRVSALAAGLSLSGRVGAAILAALLLAILVGPLVYTADPDHIALGSRLLPPLWAGGSAAYPFGTDGLGRDVLARLFSGGRTSILLAVCATVLAGAIGCLFGIVAGYAGRRVDMVINFVIITRLAMPGAVLILALIAVIGPSTTNLIFVIGLLAWPPFAIVTRVATQELVRRDFVMAAVASGSRPLQIVAQELLPNLAGPILVIATLELGYIILAEASLSFLGLGVQPPAAAWGLMLNEGKPFIHTQPWLILLPGLAILLLVLSLNLIAESLREAVDPTRLPR
jgi:peptide/nickel transport system permease protein